jgi:cellobiose phosphorylase
MTLPTRITLDASGDVASIVVGEDLQLTLLPLGAHDHSPVGVHLRRRRSGSDGTVEHAPLTGSASGFSVSTSGDAVTWSGRVLGADARVTLRPDQEAAGVTWSVHLSPLPDDAADDASAAVASGDEYDLVLVQDLGLADPTTIHTNTLYTSHYVTHRVLTGTDAPVAAVASRQTMARVPELPLAVTGWIGGARGALTDAFDLVDPAARADGRPRMLDTWQWPVHVRQYEQSVVALTSGTFTLDAPVSRTAFCRVIPDHQGPLDDALDALGTPDASDAGTPGSADSPEGAAEPVLPPRSLLADAEPLAGDDLDATQLAPLVGRAVENDAQDVPLSWFGTRDAEAPDEHTVTGAKERLVERSHGAILLSADDLDPATTHLTATTWAPGVFVSHVAYGNTNLHRVLGIHADPLGQARSHGVRILVRERGDETARECSVNACPWQILTVPSLWHSDLGRTRWTYQVLGGTVVVTTAIASGTPGLVMTLQTDLDLEALVTLEVDRDDTDWQLACPDASTCTLRADGHRAAYAIRGTGTWSDDAALWSDGVARDENLLVLHPQQADGLRLTITAGDDVPTATALLDETSSAQPDAWAADHREAFGRLTRHLDLPDEGALGEFGLDLPWFAHDAMVHVLAPHGLEQASGAAWGTRDVCQGPFEFALAFGHLDACRDLLVRIFSHQLPSGDWPQWFMYDEYSQIHAPDSHGDVIVWPLVALGEYLAATGDRELLQAELPFLDAEASGAVPMTEHLRRVLDHLDAQHVAGTVLPAYAHGDWDDTLQPADDSLRETMTSTWTTALLAGAARDLADRLTGSGVSTSAAVTDLRERFARIAEELAGEVTGPLLTDGLMPGFVRVEDGSRIPLIHPHDESSGLHHRLISLTQPVLSGLLGAEAAGTQIDAVRGHLLYGDGAHLMDHPVAWHEGIATMFKRAEQSAFFGREVGLMYTHAHLRWAETLAALGDRDALPELLRISPIGTRDRLGERALLRQRNVYYSSSDAVFATRDEASAHWDEVVAGTRPVAGGWRIYSSGPGITLRILVQDLLGWRIHRDEIVLDPLLPTGQDRLDYSVDGLGGSTLDVHVQIEDVADHDGNAEPRPLEIRSVQIDGRPLSGRRVPGPYRDRGVALPASALLGAHSLEVTMG